MLMITMAALSLSLLSCSLTESLAVILGNTRFSDLGFAGRIVDAKLTTVFDHDSPGSATLSCASGCAAIEHCAAFSIVRHEAEGKFECLVSDDPVTGTIATTADSTTYYKLNRKHGSSCIINEQCYSGFQTMTCVSWACRCPAGRVVSSDSTFCSAVDSQGFSLYPDGYAYKRLEGANASSLTAARAVCTALNTTYGLPIPYPNPWTHLALTRVMQPGDNFYLGITLQNGSTMGTRIYTTDNGTMVNAYEKDTDQAQHWGPGQPNGTSFASGSAVVMTSAGWDDVSDTTPVNSVICAKPSTFEYQEITGKFYRLQLSPFLNNSNARNVCQFERGDLAITYGAPGLQVLQHYYAQQGVKLSFWVAGTDAAEEGNWIFPDGTSLKVADNDTRSHWGQPQPNEGTSANCMYAFSNYWGDARCSAAYRFLCEI